MAPQARQERVRFLVSAAREQAEAYEEGLVVLASLSGPLNSRAVLGAVPAQGLSQNWLHNYWFDDKSTGM